MPRIQRGIEKSFTSTSTSPSFAPQTLSIQRPSPPHLTSSPNLASSPLNPSRYTNPIQPVATRTRTRTKTTVLATTNQKKKKGKACTVTHGKSPYVFFDRQNLPLFLSSCFPFPFAGVITGGSGGPELRRKSARSLVDVLPGRVSATAGALACSLGLYARGASDATEVDERAPLRVAVWVEERVEVEALARALAAAIVSGLSMKGWGLLVDGGSMPFRKSIRLSWRGAGAGAGACG